MADPRRPAALPLSVIILIAVLLAACIQPPRTPSPFEPPHEGTLRPPAPPQEPVSGPSFLILPDSELVFSPALADFSLDMAVPTESPLRAWQEPPAPGDDAEPLSALDALEKVCRDYSVSPRLLLALLEFHASAISASEQAAPLDRVFFPDHTASASLTRQLSWAANELNRGYYSRRVGGLERITLVDGTQVNLSPHVNPATAALHYLIGLMYGYRDWELAVGPLGVYASYLSLFGDPHTRAIEPLIPDDLVQPQMRLPFDPAEGWFFTAGPHSAWGNGAAWAALDFAPDEDMFGCYESQSWVLAAADGWVTRSDDGVVVQIMDGSREEAGGWSLLYLHIAADGRAPAGTFLRAGEPVGRPSCEGGISTGTHLHIARRYNGEWIPADQDIPFTLDGWVSSGDGVEYNGFLTLGERVVQALGYPADENRIIP
jgi:murein DD-endopeptidase MepM/ murein hydrolase activator NlpD